MNQEPFYPSASTGEDIQQLLPKNIGLAFKMVWDAPADSPEALKQTIEKIARYPSPPVAQHRPHSHPQKQCRLP